AAAEIEASGGAGAVGRNLEMAGAAEQRAHFAVGGVRVRRDDARDRMLADAQLERALRQLVERAPHDVRNQIAESIHPQDLPCDPVGVDLRLRNLETLKGAG